MRVHTLSPVQELEVLLGDPDDPSRLISYRRSAELDQREQFPESECHELDRLGVPAYYALPAWGGGLDRLDVCVELVRAVARRDLTLAVAHSKTFLGCAPIWVAGNETQARWLAREVVNGAVVSLGLTERDHGSDLAAGEVRAVRTATGFTLDGEKWLINNARRNHLACVLARTSPDHGPRSHSVFLIDRRALGPGQYVPLAAERLHGIRGADISGFQLVAADVPSGALVGAEGHGLEIVLKTLLLTRVMCGGLSLGAADHALEITLDHARTARRYGRPVIELPQTRRILADTLADIVLAEVLATTAARSVHALPQELAVTSAVAKYLVPTLVQQALACLSEVIGTRSLLVGTAFAEGRFQKLYRDHRIVGIFDGSTEINLNAIVNSFSFLARGRSGPASAAGLDATVRWNARLPELKPQALPLVSRSGCSFMQALPAALSAVRTLAGTPGIPPELVTGAEWLTRAGADLTATMAGRRPAARPPAEDFALAQDFATCLAGAAALHTWLANREQAGSAGAGPLWRDAAWVRAALARVQFRISGREPADQSWREPLVDAATTSGDISLLRRSSGPVERP